MRHILMMTFLSSLALAPIGIGSPTDGSWGERKEIAASDFLRMNKTFRGGERACVMAVGNHKEFTNLHLEIHDQNGTLVAEDKGDGLAGDFVAVIWYPPRDGAYRIQVRNPGTSSNACYITIK